MDAGRGDSSGAIVTVHTATQSAVQAMAFQAFVLRCQCPFTLLVDFYTPTLFSELLGTFLSLGVFSLLGVFAGGPFLVGLSVNQVRVLCDLRPADRSVCLSRISCPVNKDAEA